VGQIARQCVRSVFDARAFSRSWMSTDPTTKSVGRYHVIIGNYELTPRRYLRLQNIEVIRLRIDKTHYDERRRTGLHLRVATSTHRGGKRSCPMKNCRPNKKR
jgi:hypothetical protein